jgi:hypothetical protein
MTFLVVVWLTVGTIYGAQYARSYAQRVSDVALIMLLSAFFWPALLYLERKG